MVIGPHMLIWVTLNDSLVMSLASYGLNIFLVAELEFYTLLSKRAMQKEVNGHRIVSLNKPIHISLKHYSMQQSMGREVLLSQKFLKIKI